MGTATIFSALSMVFLLAAIVWEVINTIRQHAKDPMFAYRDITPPGLRRRTKVSFWTVVLFLISILFLGISAKLSVRDQEMKMIDEMSSTRLRN